MRRVSSRAPGAIAAAWLAAVIAAGCGDEASPAEGESSAPLARCELPRGGYVDACNECLAARCCEPIEACKAGVDCSTQLDCMLGCQYASDPPGCSRACLAAGRQPDYVAFDDCSFDACRDQCWL
jgi:hypothetical protein